MDYIWRLLTAIFLIVVAVALLVVAFVFGFNTVFGVFVYVSLFCILFGIAKGLMVMIDYHRSQKEMQE